MITLTGDYRGRARLDREFRGRTVNLVYTGDYGTTVTGRFVYVDDGYIALADHSISADGPRLMNGSPARIEVLTAREAARMSAD